MPHLFLFAADLCGHAFSKEGEGNGSAVYFRVVANNGCAMGSCAQSLVGQTKPVSQCMCMLYRQSAHPAAFVEVATLRSGIKLYSQMLYSATGYNIYIYASVPATLIF